VSAYFQRLHAPLALLLVASACACAHIGTREPVLVDESVVNRRKDNVGESKQRLTASFEVRNGSLGLRLGQNCAQDVHPVRTIRSTYQRDRQNLQPKADWALFVAGVVLGGAGAVALAEPEGTARALRDKDEPDESKQLSPGEARGLGAALAIGGAACLTIAFIDVVRASSSERIEQLRDEPDGDDTTVGCGYSARPGTTIRALVQNESIVLGATNSEGVLLVDLAQRMPPMDKRSANAPIELVADGVLIGRLNDEQAEGVHERADAREVDPNKCARLDVAACFRVALYLRRHPRSPRANEFRQLTANAVAQLEALATRVQQAREQEQQRLAAAERERALREREEQARREQVEAERRAQEAARLEREAHEKQEREAQARTAASAARCRNECRSACANDTACISRCVAQSCR